MVQLKCPKSIRRLKVPPLLAVTGATEKKKAHLYSGSRVMRPSKETTLFGLHFVQRFCAPAYCRKTKDLKTIIPQHISAEILSNPNLKSFVHLTQGKCLHGKLLYDLPLMGLRGLCLTLTSDWSNLGRIINPDSEWMTAGRNLWKPFPYEGMPGAVFMVQKTLVQILGVKRKSHMGKPATHCSHSCVPSSDSLPLSASNATQ